MRLSKSLKQLIKDTARDAYAKGVADGERKVLVGLKAVAQLNGSFGAVAPLAGFKAEADDSHALLVSAMLQVAEDAVESGDDPADALKALAALSQDPDRLRDILAGGTLQKAWDESLHPRADNGRFIGKDQLQAAKSDPALAQKLRDKTTDPGERAKLDKVLSGEADPGRTRRGEQRHQAQQKRQATESDRRRAHQIAMRAFSGGLGYDDFEELADLLPSLTVEQLRSVRAAVGASWGGQRLKRQGMVDTLVAFARQQAAPPEQDAPGSPEWQARMMNRPDEPKPRVDAWESAKVDDAADRAERMGRWEADRPDSEAAQAVAGSARAGLAGAREFERAAGVNVPKPPAAAADVPAEGESANSTGLEPNSPAPIAEPAAPPASRLDELEADANRRLAEAEKPLAGNRYAGMSDADLGAARHRLAAKVAGLKQSATATGDEAVTAEAQTARDRLAEADAELSRRVLAARLRRRLQAVQESRESGRLTVSESEMRELLAQAKDAYREDGLRGRVPYSPDHFRTSDLTGAKIRHFVELPDGRIAHPDELTQAQRRGRLNVVPDAELPGAFTTARTAEQLAAAQPAQPPAPEPMRDAGNPPEGAKKPSALEASREQFWASATPSPEAQAAHDAAYAELNRLQTQHLRGQMAPAPVRKVRHGRRDVWEVFDPDTGTAYQSYPTKQQAEQQASSRWGSRVGSQQIDAAREKYQQARQALEKTAVQAALAAGKPVPPEVLADYPDLKPANAPLTPAPSQPAAGPAGAATAPAATGGNTPANAPLPERADILPSGGMDRGVDPVAAARGAKQQADAARKKRSNVRRLVDIALAGGQWTNFDLADLVDAGVGTQKIRQYFGAKKKQESSGTNRPGGGDGTTRQEPAPAPLPALTQPTPYGPQAVVTRGGLVVQDGTGGQAVPGGGTVGGMNPETPRLTAWQEKGKARFRRQFPDLTDDEAHRLAATLPEPDPANRAALGRANEAADTAARQAVADRRFPAPPLAALTAASDKQREYAEKVRDQRLAAIRRRMAEDFPEAGDSADGLPGEPSYDRQLARVAELHRRLSRLAQVKSAAWWLDHKHVDHMTGPADMFDRLVPAGGG